MYIIFGCGNVGKAALNRIGAEAVLCFASNHDYDDRRVCGKDVISFSEMVNAYEEHEDIVIVIATANFRKELEEQTRDAGIRRYFVFQDIAWPGYAVDYTWKSPSCSEVIKNFDLTEYRRIGVYGESDGIPLWAAEIQRQNPTAEIMMIPADCPTGDLNSSIFPVISLDDADTKIDCLCVTIPPWKDMAAIRDRFFLDPAPYAMTDIYDVDRFEPAFHYAGMEKYKGIHEGERIFIIGNGPSLTIEDLNTLHRHGEICMGFNKVYRAYDRTPWRADYLGFTDTSTIDDCTKDIPALPGTIFMADTFHYSANSRFPDIQYFHMVLEEYLPNFPKFSDDPSQCTYWGYTVTYDIGLQLAAYMGFKEIYLLGMDNTYGKNKFTPENYFIEDYYLPEEIVKPRDTLAHEDKMTKAYEKAERYSRQHGFRIFNATRGGALEAFERVNFDDLFQEIFPYQ